jgi:hypothetical protein
MKTRKKYVNHCYLCCFVNLIWWISHLGRQVAFATCISATGGYEPLDLGEVMAESSNRFPPHRLMGPRLLDDFRCGVSLSRGRLVTGRGRIANKHTSRNRNIGYNYPLVSNQLRSWQLASQQVNLCQIFGPVYERNWLYFLIQADMNWKQKERRPSSDAKKV